VRYLWWLMRCQKRRIAVGAVLGSTWMAGLTLLPYLLSQAVDHGLQRRDLPALAAWVGLLFVAGAVNAMLAMLRHRTMTRIRLDGAFRTLRAVLAHATQLGSALPRRLGAGEVVTIGVADVWVLAQALTVTGPGLGAVLSYGIVAVLLLRISPLLAVVVLAGVPVLAVAVAPMLRSLQHAGLSYRERQGELADRLVDVVGGLKVLNGLGGKETFAVRYRRESQAVADEGYRVGAVTSWIQAFGTGLPALFLAVVIWLAARMAAQGTITAGELIAVWGYAAMLVVPVAFLIEGGFDIGHALVAGRRILEFLRLPAEPPRTINPPRYEAALFDPQSGVRVAPGRFTALAAARTCDAAAVVDRLGGYGPTDATWGDGRVGEQAVREWILVAEPEAYLFRGTLRDVVAGRQEPDDRAVAWALHVAAADDIVDGLLEGTALMVEERGRNLSGGQRQRIRLARALFADPEILLAVDPTSAVDAHTEAAIAERLPAARDGRTTLVTTTSPALLERADIVHYLVAGRVTASGTHRELLGTEPGYRDLVIRAAGSSSAATARSPSGAGSSCAARPRSSSAARSGSSSAAGEAAAAWGLISQDRRAVSLMVVLNAVAAIAGLAGPWLLGRIIDAVAAGTATVHMIDRLALAILLCTLAQVLLARTALVVGYRFGERTAARVRERFLDRILALPPAVAERVPAGDLAARGTADVGAVATTLRDAVPEVLIAAGQAVFVLVAVFFVDPLLGAIGVLGLSGITVATRWYLRRARRAYLDEGAAGSALADQVTAAVNGARTVEALGLQERRAAAGRAVLSRAWRTRLRTLFLRSVYYPWVDISYVVPVVAVLLIGGALYTHGQLSLGAVAAAALYLRQLAVPLDAILIWLEQLQASGASFARLEGLADLPSVARSHSIPCGDRIEVRDVRYCYDGGRDVLRGVDLTVRPGERLALVGPSGAGKSTLGRLLAGVDRPRAGTVTAGGVPVASLPPDVLRRQVVLVTQEHHIFHDALRTNLTLAAPEATDEDLLSALEVVGADWVPDLPEGLDTRLGGAGYELDGARAQQVALARVVLADPHTVVLDEATALLDPAKARAAERALAAVLHSRTVIAIAHRLQTAHDADRVAVMEAGRLVELGTHDELVAAGGAYAALWRTWHG
jgi:ATP-binding cassette subfamily C protein